MFTVYALYSENFNKIYIGFTSNIEQRLFSHNQLDKRSFTARFRPWKIIYSEEYDLKVEAMKREKQLKSAKGREFIWDLVQKN